MVAAEPRFNGVAVSELLQWLARLMDMPQCPRSSGNLAAKRHGGTRYEVFSYIPYDIGELARIVRDVLDERARHCGHCAALR